MVPVCDKYCPKCNDDFLFDGRENLTEKNHRIVNVGRTPKIISSCHLSNSEVQRNRDHFSQSHTGRRLTAGFETLTKILRVLVHP